ncbi:MAG TPA: D-glycerate dehydrogenase [Dehalococcoidia bacterium]|nr:D-glycerate dehydrogenase [Dehalococcoidia bacterium]
MPAKPRILVTRPLPPPAIKRLEAVAEVQVLDGERPSNETLREQSADKHGILALLGARVDEQLIRGAPRLYAVSNLGTGYDNIDVDAASKHGVLVTRTPGVLTETTADLTFALILDVARRVSEGDRFVRAGTWASGQQLPFGRDVHGATLGIIGLGNIGTAVARRGRAFGMNVLYHSRTHKPAMERRLRLKYLSLDDLLKQSDFVVLLAALTPQTKGMIGEKQLRMMKPGAMLINVARGSMVDSEALYEAVKDGHLGGAALDVTEPEPTPKDFPLLTLPNVVVTPHIGSATTVTRQAMMNLALDNMIGALQGRIPRNTVNREIEPQWRQARKQRLAAR